MNDFYDSKRPIKQIFALGQIKGKLKGLKGGKIDAIDARLLKGVFTCDDKFLEIPKKLIPHNNPEPIVSQLDLLTKNIRGRLLSAGTNPAQQPS